MKIIRKKEAAARVGYHPVHMMRRARNPEDDMPTPVKIGPAAVGFVEEEIDDWIKARIEERNTA